MSDITVCQVLHGLDVGGAEVLAARLARRLRGAFRFVFVCLDQLGVLGQRLSEEGFAVHVLGRKQGVDLRCTRELARVMQQERIDLLHAHQYTPFFYGATARLLWRKAPVLFTEHGRWFPDYPRRKRMIANRLLLERRDRVVGVGEAVRGALIHNEGIPARRVAVIYNGIDLSAFANQDGQRDVVRRELGLEPGSPVIIQVARLDVLKDHATAIRTIGHVVKQRPDARLLIVGDGPEGQAIRGLVQQEGLTEQVRFLGLRNDVPRLLAASDVALLTSVSEGIPLTLIEAMAARLPVVSTKVGGVSEIVEEERTGLLGPSGDPRALADQLLRLLGDPDLRERMGQLGLERAYAFFSEEQMHDRYQRLYSEMLQGRRASA